MTPLEVEHNSMNSFTDPNAWIGLFTLTLLEIVLGVDNIVFISILTGKLPAKDREKARRIGLILALVPRLALLLAIPLVMRLTRPLFTISSVGISGQDLVLIVGGLFLIAKATQEIHHKLEGVEGEVSAKVFPSFSSVITQIMLLNLVFSLDSIITAIGMVKQLWVMIAAVLISTGFMLLFSGKVGAFIEKHPTVKILALSFLLLIGTNLIVEGVHYHIPKGYTYFAMAFSVAVEMLNLKFRAKQAAPVHLREWVVDAPQPAGKES